MELAETIPSTAVLRDVANQARHLYAVSARLAAECFTAGLLPENSARVIHTELQVPAQVMHRLQQQWDTVTTATKPTHQYVTSTSTLHAALTAIERKDLLPIDHIDPAKGIDLNQAMADLRYAATDLVELTHTSAQLPEPLIRSGLLFAPARILPSTMEHLNARNRGRYVSIDLKEGRALIDAAHDGSRAAQQVRSTLEHPSRPTAATDLSIQSRANEFSRPALGLSMDLDA
jgi:hypothetical protein